MADRFLAGMLRSLLALVATACVARAVDIDQDGIDDADEQTLLVRHSPSWTPHDNSQRPPLPLDWYVRHCQLRWYSECMHGSFHHQTRLGDTGNQVLSVDQLANFNYVGGAEYRLSFKAAPPPLFGNYRDGQDPLDPITWAGLQGDPSRKVVLGRVTRVPGSTSLYTVMYFILFGMNVTDAPNSSLGICTDWGDHEGDVIGVEFTVYATSIPASSQIVSAVYNNHGRKIFIDDATGLEYRNGRPIVYLERESQEPWPVRGNCGFGQIAIPESIGTDEVFPGVEVMGWSFGAECEDWQVSREHQGAGTPFVHTTVVNIGEKGRPMDSAEARFLDRFGGSRACGAPTPCGTFTVPPAPITNSGRFGDYANNEICICYLFDQFCIPYKGGESPMGPSAQGSMWSPRYDEFGRTEEFPGRVQKVTGVSLGRDQASLCTIRVSVSVRNAGPAVVWLESGHPSLSFANPAVWIPPGRHSGVAVGALDLTLIPQDATSIKVSATAVPPGFHTPASAIRDVCGNSLTFAQAFSDFSRSAHLPISRSVTELDATRTSDPGSPITVRWMKVCGATQYAIYRDDDVFPIALAPDTPSLWLSYSDTTAAPCQAHRYQVEARFSNGPAPLSPIVIGFAGLAFKDIVLSTDFLQGRGSYSGRVELWGPPDSPSTIGLASTNPGLLQVPFSVNMPAGSPFSAFFPVENYPNLCPPPTICAPTQVLLSAESETCHIRKPFWVQPADTWPEFPDVAPVDVIAGYGASVLSSRCVDVDRDGIDEVVAMELDDLYEYRFAVYKGVADGVPTIASRLVFYQRPPLPSLPIDAWAVGNFDGNSLPDLVAENMRVVRDIGGMPALVVNSGPSPQSTDFPFMGVFDMNGDGLDDVVGVVSNDTSRIQIRWRLSTGSGLFGPMQEQVYITTPTQVTIRSFHAADVDGDGIVDLIVNARTNPPAMTSGTAYVFRGTGTGFALAPDSRYQYTYGPQTAHGFLIVDLDRDGKNDLCVLKARFVDPNASLFFTPMLQIVYGWGTSDERRSEYRIRDGDIWEDPEGFAVRDMDGDGDLDFVVHLSGSTLLFRQDAVGRFNYPGDVLVFGPSEPRVTGDLDGDGDVDLLQQRGSFPNSGYGVRVGLNTSAPPRSFQLHRPSEGVSTATGSVQFIWGSASAAQSYTIHVARDAQFQTLVASVTTAQTSATLTLPLEHEGRFYWRVTAVNPQGTQAAYPGVASFEMFDLNSIDCNGNGRYDSLDIGVGFSSDVNGNGLPDECERCPADYDQNGFIEPADIALFVNRWFIDLNSGTLVTDVDHNGAVEPADVSFFVSIWFNALSNGC